MFIYQDIGHFLKYIYLFWLFMNCFEMLNMLMAYVKSAVCYYCSHSNNFVGNGLILKLARNELALNIHFCRTVFHSDFSIGHGGSDGGFGLPKINLFRRLRDFWFQRENLLKCQLIYSAYIYQGSPVMPRRHHRDHRDPPILPLLSFISFFNAAGNSNVAILLIKKSNKNNN